MADLKVIWKELLRFSLGMLILWIIIAFLVFILIPFGLGQYISIILILPTAWLIGRVLTWWF